LYINNNFYIRPGGSFGVNVDAIVANAIDQDIEVVNNTQYAIRFEIDPAVTGRSSAQLIEIFIKKEQ
jgi:hypothetical protein